MDQTATGSAAEAIPGGTMKVLLDEQTIIARVSELAVKISRDYSEKDLVLVAILKGAQIFVCDLIRRLSVHASLDFMSISRYKRSAGTTGVTITRDLPYIAVIEI